MIIGIDPGLDGGIACVEQDGAFAWAVRMPVIKHKSAREYDEKQVRSWLTSSCTLAVIEKQIPMARTGIRRAGSKQNFRTGDGYGLLRGILVGLGVRFEIISAPQWQKVMFAGMPRSDTKVCSLLKCSRLWPKLNLVPEGCRVPHDGMADALLIAEYGRRTMA